MNKQQVLQALEDGRERFVEVLEGLEDKDFEAPGVVGEWSVKDLLVHLARWEAELVKLLWQVRLGERPTTVHFGKLSVDEVNARWSADSRGRLLEQALEDFHGVRAQTLLRVEAFQDAELEEPRRFKVLEGKALWTYIATDSFDHEAEHLAQLQAWREARRGAAA